MRPDGASTRVQHSVETAQQEQFELEASSPAVVLIIARVDATPAATDKSPVN
jgi:hypothetical protein